MPPRFVNPYFLPVSSIPVSRDQIYREDGDDETSFDADPQLVTRLKELISINWNWQSEHEERSAKRRRLRSPSYIEEDRAISFRLVSTSQPPYPISLRPKTPPPPVTREPEIEDTEAQALLRAERAKAAAIDAATIITESCQHTPHYGDPMKLREARTISTLTSPPVAMIVECQQPSRSTRPPVPTSQLEHHPYKHTSALPSSSVISTSVYPVIELAPNSLLAVNTGKRRRRKKLIRERPPPAFWKPNPAVGGKCFGYAMGYPCSMKVLQTGENTFIAYPRDTMRSIPRHI